MPCSKHFPCAKRNASKKRNRRRHNTQNVLTCKKMYDNDYDNYDDYYYYYYYYRNNNNYCYDCCYEDIDDYDHSDDYHEYGKFWFYCIKCKVIKDRSKRRTINGILCCETKIDGKSYYMKLDADFISIRPGTLFNSRVSPDNPLSMLSDHLPIRGEYEGLRILSINICMNRLFLRKKQGIYNSDDKNLDPKWRLKITGDSLSEDIARRHMICNYLREMLNECDVICVQEIDYDSIQILLEYCHIAFEEPYENSNTGGVAILVNKNCQIFRSKKIIDYWISNEDNKLKSKLIGQYVIMAIGSKKYRISNFHLDCDSAHESFPNVAEHALESNFIVGDFNRSQEVLINGVNDEIRKLSCDKNTTQIKLEPIIISSDFSENMVDHIIKVSIVSESSIVV